MCGIIAGTDIPVNLYEHIEGMAYRGLPGFKGYTKGGWGQHQFAHYALPFVNLDPKVAIQPIFSQRENHPCVFAGEIFNYKELGFDTDSRCIAETFHMKDLPDFHEFEGFWSFATLYKGKLFALTDFLSIKPVYYRTDMTVVASEIDILKGLAPVTRDELFHSNVMKWGYDPNGLTPWNEIKQLPPGHFYWDGEICNYWDWSKVKCGDLRSDIIKAVENRLGGQRDVSILLSGGLDSSIVYSILTKILGKDVTAIHVENHEDQYVKLLNPSKLVPVFLDDVSDTNALRIHQSPVDLGSVKPQIAMARKLRELGFYAVLTGDGADELFGGYRRSNDYDSQFSDTFIELPYYHLPKLDRTMMRSTIELRAPFLSPKVVAGALKIDWVHRRGEKRVLKELFADIVPQEILNRDKLPLKTDAIRADPMEVRMRNEMLWRIIYGV
jgi:asparagine synthase (glutamine-hydrolysing)